MTETRPSDRHRPVRAAWVGGGMLGVAFVLFGLFTLSRGDNVPTAFIALVLGAVTIVDAVRLRRDDPAGVRLAAIALRFLLVIVAGSPVYSATREDWGTALWSLVVTVLCAVVVAALSR